MRNLFIQYLFTDPLFYLRIVVILIISICLHELGHGIAAIYQGDDTPIKRGHMTLDPLVHMGPQSLVFLAVAGIAWGAMPVNPKRFKDPKWGNILVSAAGPITNFVLGILAIALIRVSSQTFLSGIISENFLYYIAYINFGLGFFNLCPIPPLDGFNVASEFYTPMKSLERSQIGYALFMILFITGAGSVFFQLAHMLAEFLIYL